MRYLIGTRGSKLALVQTDYVIDKLKRAYPDDDFKAVIIKTTGDLEQKKALDKIGSKGIFVKEIEEELLSGKIHMAVHSMKDMPDEPAAGLTFAVIGASVAENFGVQMPEGTIGRSILKELQ